MCALQIIRTTLLCQIITSALLITQLISRLETSNANDCQRDGDLYPKIQFPVASIQSSQSICHMRITLNMIDAPVLVVAFVLQLAASGHRLAETLRFIALHSFACLDCP